MEQHHTEPACTRVRQHQPLPGQRQRVQDLPPRERGAYHCRADAAASVHRTSLNTQAVAVLGALHAAVSDRQLVAFSSEDGFRTDELEDLAHAFERGQIVETAERLGR